jgi:hypothetical protein
MTQPDMNNPAVQDAILSAGRSWPAVPDSMAPTPRTDYAESDYVVRDPDLSAAGMESDDSVIADDAEGPAEVAWPVPDYSMVNPALPADVMGVGFPGDLPADDLTAVPTSEGPVAVPKPPPGSIASHVDLSDDPGNLNVIADRTRTYSMGRGEDV